MTSNEDLASITFRIEAGDEPVVLTQLQTCLDEISRPSLDSLSTTESFSLFLTSVDIGPRVLPLLVQILNHPLPKKPTASDFRWDHVELHACKFALGGTFFLEANTTYVFNRYLLGAALASRTLELVLKLSPQLIVATLNGASKLEMTKLLILESRLPALEWGDLLQRSVRLKRLELFVSQHMAQPWKLVESLANAIHVQTLIIGRWDGPGFVRRQQVLTDLPVVRQGGHDFVLQLLQNPLSQLQALNMPYMDLEDPSFIALVEILPTSNIVELGVMGNHIQRQGVLALAAELPKIKHLRILQIVGNPWESQAKESQDNLDAHEECWAALLEGSRNNYSLEILLAGTGYGRFPTEIYKFLVGHYCNLNRAGRRLVEAPHNIPEGLWAFLLERAGKDTYYVNRLALTLEQFESVVARYRANSVYFLLQNSPVLSLLCSAY